MPKQTKLDKPAKRKPVDSYGASSKPKKEDKQKKKKIKKVNTVPIPNPKKVGRVKY
tara:strand:+ start:431 stop:598 length:168 start_codon:yes stop_codon:yes gene_type:complete